MSFKKNESISFIDLGITEELWNVCQNLKWKSPTPIQRETIPIALQGKDIIGLAVTGSGKTGAFALPIIQSLLQKPHLRFYALVLSPTRELAMQIKEQFDSLGCSFGLQTCLVVGGVDSIEQAIEIGRHPHVIIATPGRLVEHLQKTKGFNLNAFKYLVLDEADRILDLGFEEEVDLILKALPRKRRNLLFSATMTNKVNRLRRAHLKKNVVRIEISSRYQTADNLEEFMVHIDILEGVDKNMYLHHILRQFENKSVIIFCASCQKALKLSIMLRKLKYKCVPLRGDMDQTLRMKALSKFKEKKRNVLVATDIASRGLDIADVDLVINYDVPPKSKVYIHRVGRTARAGKEGTAITFVMSGDFYSFKNIEEDLGYEEPRLMAPFFQDDVTEQILDLKAQVAEADRLANAECRERAFQVAGNKKKKRFEDDEEDTEQSQGFRKKIRKNKES